MLNQKYVDTVPWKRFEKFILTLKIETPMLQTKLICIGFSLDLCKGFQHKYIATR